MTEQERAFDAWFESLPKDRASGYIELARQAFLQGWKRERVKAKPKVVEIELTDAGYRLLEVGGYNLRDKIMEFRRDNDLFNGTKLRVTVEEV